MLELVPAIHAARAHRIGRGYAIVPASVEHLHALASHLRAQDEAEILGLGVSVKKALWRAYRNSVLCKAALVDGEVAAVWGLCLGLRPGVNLLSDTGVPWLHTSYALERMPIAFIKEARREVAAMRAVRPRLENHVLTSYASAIRFIKMMGFTVDPPEFTGVKGILYCRFHMGCE
jgi:hypothetical protein